MQKPTSVNRLLQEERETVRRACSGPRGQVEPGIVIDVRGPRVPRGQAGYARRLEVFTAQTIEADNALMFGVMPELFVDIVVGSRQAQ